MRYVAYVEFIRAFAFCVVLFGIIGCVATDRYKSCLGDLNCAAEVEATRVSTYNTVKSASSIPGVPSLPEVLAVLVSNLAAFGVGVYKGRKVKGG